MAQDPNSALGQMSAVYSGLSSFFQALANHIDDGIAPPSLATFLDLKIDEAVALSVLSTEKGASDRVGALVEASHCYASIVREHGMATSDRITLYSNAQNEAQTDSEYADSLDVTSTSTFKTGV